MIEFSNPPKPPVGLDAAALPASFAAAAAAAAAVVSTGFAARTFVAISVSTTGTTGACAGAVADPDFAPSDGD